MTFVNLVVAGAFRLRTYLRADTEIRRWEREDLPRGNGESEMEARENEESAG